MYRAHTQKQNHNKTTHNQPQKKNKKQWTHSLSEWDGYKCELIICVAKKLAK